MGWQMRLNYFCPLVAGKGAEFIWRSGSQYKKFRRLQCKTAENFRHVTARRRKQNLVRQIKKFSALLVVASNALIRRVTKLRPFGNIASYVILIILIIMLHHYICSGLWKMSGVGSIIRSCTALPCSYKGLAVPASLPTSGSLQKSSN